MFGHMCFCGNFDLRLCACALTRTRAHAHARTCAHAHTHTARCFRRCTHAETSIYAYGSMFWQMYFCGNIDLLLRVHVSADAFYGFIDLRLRAWTHTRTCAHAHTRTRARFDVFADVLLRKHRFTPTGSCFRRCVLRKHRLSLARMGAHTHMRTRAHAHTCTRAWLDVFADVLLRETSIYSYGFMFPHMRFTEI
jgi:hypothetical protein